MPSVSEKQRRFMSAAAHNPKFAKEAGIPQTVAREFHAADAGKSYGATPSRRKIAEALIKR
jgi:hypothetical protein